MSKRKGKKYNPNKVRDSYVKARLGQTWLADGKCCAEMERGGIQYGHPWCLDHINAISGWTLPWRIWLGVFQIDQDGREFVTEGYLDNLPAATSTQLGGLLDDQLRQLVDSQNPKFAIGWGWFAVPVADADLEAMSDQIIEQFRDWGAFDRAHCERTHAIRVETETLYEQERAAA